MMDAVLGIDTSCYTTSAAAVTLDGRVLCSSRKLLPVSAGERGLRQSEMVFLHTRQLPERLEETAAAIRGYRLRAVSVSARPRDEEASYMPAFQVGDAQARGIAAMLGIPVFETTHQRGHIRAAMVDSGIQLGPLLALHLSGGTTELLSLEDDRLTLLGGTADLHAGQLVDRAGVALGLAFPAGPQLEAMAVRASAEARLPVSMEEGGLRCHLSGAESQVQRWIAAGRLSPEQIAAEIYDFLARTVARLILAGAEKTHIRQALAAGGVASSALFRTLLSARIAKQDRAFRLCFGKPEYSGDNAVGAALLGVDRLRTTD